VLVTGMEAATRAQSQRGNRLAVALEEGGLLLGFRLRLMEKLGLGFILELSLVLRLGFVSANSLL
jgi:hypothetical protein